MLTAGGKSRASDSGAKRPRRRNSRVRQGNISGYGPAITAPAVGVGSAGQPSRRELEAIAAGVVPGTSSIVGATVRGLALGVGAPSASGSTGQHAKIGGRTRMAPSTMLLALAAGDPQLARAAEAAAEAGPRAGAPLPGRRSEPPAKYRITEVREHAPPLAMPDLSLILAMPCHANTQQIGAPRKFSCQECP